MFFRPLGFLYKSINSKYCFSITLKYSTTTSFRFPCNSSSQSAHRKEQADTSSVVRQTPSLQKVTPRPRTTTHQLPSGCWLPSHRHYLPSFFSKVSTSTASKLVMKRRPYVTKDLGNSHSECRRYVCSSFCKLRSPLIPSLTYLFLQPF